MNCSNIHRNPLNAASPDFKPLINSRGTEVRVLSEVPPIIFGVLNASSFAGNSLIKVRGVSQTMSQWVVASAKRSIDKQWLWQPVGLLLDLSVAELAIGGQII